MVSIQAMFDELEKIAVGGLPAGLSMGGLAGLTGLEAHGAMDKKKSTKERVKSGLGAASTGAILASEAMEHKDMLKKGLEHAKGLIKKAPAATHLLKAGAAISPANMKMMQQHGMNDAYKASKTAPAAAPALRGQSQTFSAEQLGGHGPSLELAKKPMPKPMARPAVSPQAAARASGVMGRIGSFFKGK